MYLNNFIVDYMQSKITTNDALILLAVDSNQGFFKNGIALDDIIWIIDAVDRNVLTYEEFSDSLNRLLSVGFIKMKNEKIYTTEYFRKQKKNYCKRVSGVTKQLQEIKNLLSKSIDKNPDQEFNNSIDNFINLNFYETAVTNYRIKVDEYISKIK
jgi:hypothetical protein